MKNQNQYLFLAILCLFSLVATGCGVKPSKLDSPSELDKPHFPATYPQKTQKP